MANNSQQDCELIKQYLDGNKASLDTLINKHKSKVFSYILMVVKNRELAEDIFQDAFIKVIRSLHAGKYNDEGRFVSWVMRIAHNLIIDHYRKDKQLKTISDDDSEVPLLDTVQFAEVTVEQNMVVEQIHKDIKHLVEKLPDEQKEVVKLRYYYDMSFKEIADLTGVSINTALGRMRYAIINLRKISDESKVDLRKI